MEEESREKKEEKKKSHRSGVKFDPFYIEGSIRGLGKPKEKDDKKDQK